MRKFQVKALTSVFCVLKMIARKRKMLINNDTIVKDTDPVIRTVSAPVPLPLSKEDEQLLREMFQYVQDSDRKSVV